MTIYCAQMETAQRDTKRYEAHDRDTVANDNVFVIYTTMKLSCRCAFP